MNAEQLIDLYLEGKKTQPKAATFSKQIVKGQKVKPDSLLDLPFRDTANNVDQDISWRASSTSPYQ